MTSGLLAHLATAYPIPSRYRSIATTHLIVVEVHKSSQVTPAVVLANATQLTILVPPDNSISSAANLICLDVVASTRGPYDLTYVNYISASSGFTCSFGGAAGWNLQQDKDVEVEVEVDMGWLTIGSAQPSKVVEWRLN